MKKFCILEQGGTVDDDLTLQHKRQFNTGVSDFYRLNWKNSSDRNADIYMTDICNSEGRSVLYDYVNKDYEYYIFIDDDIIFQDKINFNVCKPSLRPILSCFSDIAYRIAEMLDEYNPIAGTFESFATQRVSWHFEGVKSNKKVHPIAGFDGSVHILSRSFAQVMLPMIYHGAPKVHWYTSYVCHTLFPKKQLVFRNIKAKNTRAGIQEAANPVAGENIIDKFEKDLYLKGDFARWNNMRHVKQLNVSAYDLEPDKTKIDFDIYDLAKIYDINNKDFKNRKPILK